MSYYMFSFLVTFICCLQSLIGLWVTLYSNVRYFNSKSLENSLQPAICLNNINKSNLNSCVSVCGKKHKNNISIKNHNNNTSSNSRDIYE